MNPLLKQLFDYIDSLPQTSFNEVRAQRAAAGGDLEAQRRLSLEDRRAYARDYLQERGSSAALGMALAIPGEQAVKALGFGDSGSRSGFHDPVGSIKAGYDGILQGLDDNGMFGRGLKR